MSVPTEKDVEGCKRYVFLEGNRVPYFMDHGFHAGLPAGVVFRDASSVVRSVFKTDRDEAELVAPGYGMSGQYGNGSVHVRRRHLPTSLDDVFMYGRL